MSFELSKLNSLIINIPGCSEMIDFINESKPEIEDAINQHCKSHSQFQYSTIDCSGPIAGPTKIRNWRQVCAVIQHTIDALEDANYEYMIKKEEAKILLSRSVSEKNDILKIESQRSECIANRIAKNMAGAIRKLASYVAQFKELERQIRIDLNKDKDEQITEEDFERDEERFHIMKAFEQSLLSTYSNGRIDNGNAIYLSDIGIDYTMAQIDINAYIELKVEYINSNPKCSPSELCNIYFKWLDNMYKKYSGCSKELLNNRGLLSGIQNIAICKI